MAGRTPPQNQTPNPIGSRGKETGICSSLLSKRPGFDIMHNCDSPPPPLNIFPGNEMMLVLQSKKRVCTESTQEEEKDEKMEIMKALRLSQTRAREAERRIVVLTKERDVISNALLHESSWLFAYRQWVKLLELEVSVLQRQQKGPVYGGNVKKAGDDNEGGGSMVCFVALALCFSIASLGFVIGC